MSEYEPHQDRLIEMLSLAAFAFLYVLIHCQRQLNLHWASLANDLVSSNEGLSASFEATLQTPPGVAFVRCYLVKNGLLQPKTGFWQGRSKRTPPPRGIILENSAGLQKNSPGWM